MNSRTRLTIAVLALCTLLSAPSAAFTWNLTRLVTYHPPPAEELIGVKISGDLASVSAGSSGLAVKKISDPSPAHQRTALAELFGATWCYNCALASAAIDSLVQEFGPDSLIVLEYHWADELAIPQGEDRARWYAPGPFSIPNTWFDGVINVVGANSGVYDTYRSHVLDRLSVPSPLSIELEVALYQASASIRVVGPLPDTDLTAHFVVYENNVEDRYDYVVRDILPAGDLSLSSVGDSVVVVREYDIDPSCDPDQLGVVVFVQSDSTKSILQATKEVLAFCPSDNEDTLQDDNAGNITGYKLSQNYPNPFNPTTSIEFALPKSGEVRIDVFNILGQRVRTLVDHCLTPGRHLTAWDGRDDSGEEVASGVYFYRLESQDFVETRRMLLMR